MREYKLRTIRSRRYSPILIFNPTTIVEYEHARAQFVLSLVLSSSDKKQEAVEYLESAKERMEALTKIVTPSHVDLGSSNPLICKVNNFQFLSNIIFLGKSHTRGNTFTSSRKRSKKEKIKSRYSMLIFNTSTTSFLHYGRYRTIRKTYSNFKRTCIR